MKWLFLYLIFPFLCWASCEDLKKSIETCSVYACEISHPSIGRLLGYKILGKQNGTCLIETEGANAKKGLDLGENCHLKDKILPAMAESVAAQVGIVNLMFEMLSMSETDASAASPERMSSFQNKIADQTKLSTQLAVKLNEANGGKSPCVPKNVAAMAKFSTMAIELADGFKPLIFSSQLISNEKFSKLFPDQKPACVVSTDFQDFNTAKRLGNITDQEDCKKLESAKCSDIFHLSQLKKISCPVELNIVYAEADKATGSDIKTVPGTLVKSMVCEINGMMRTGKTLTFDPDFKRQMNKYCKRPKGYACKARLLAGDEVVELESLTEIIQSRDGAEVNCLKLAKKLSRPHCENSSRKIFAQISLVVDGRTDTSAYLLNQTFSDFCYTHRLKRFFQ